MQDHEVLQQLFGVPPGQRHRAAQLTAAAKHVRSAGRAGDSILVHVNPHEFRQMQHAWGENSINPHTGLPEYGFFSKLVQTLKPTHSHVRAILKGAKDTLKGKRIFGGTPLGTKLSNLVTGRHDKPIADQYGGMTDEEKKKFVAKNGGDPNSLGYSQELHAIGSAIGSYYAGNYASGQLGQLFGGGGAAGSTGGAAGAAGSATGGGGAVGTEASGTGSILGSLFGGGNTGDWISTLANLYGAYQSSQGAKNSQDQLNAAMAGARTTLGGNTLIGPGGVNATTYNNGEGGTYGLGDGLDQLRQALQQFSGNNVQLATSGGGVPALVQQAATGVQSASPTAAAPDFSNLLDKSGSALQQAFSQLGQGSVAPGLAATAFKGAGDQLAAAGGNFNDVRDQTLANLRAQAQPFETRAYDTLNNDLFATGRSGTSGGALQTEAFARGLAQNDTARVLQANQEARNQQSQALGIGQGLAGVGTGVSGLDDQLLNSAFGRFAQTAGLDQGLQQQRFGNSVLNNQTAYDRAQGNLGNQISLAQLPLALQGSQLQLALQSLGGETSLQQTGLQQFQAALAQAQAAANARIGSGSNVAALAGLQAQLPNTNDIWGQVLTGIGSRTGSGNGSLGNILSGLFGGTSAPKTPPANNYGNDPRAVGYGP